MGISKIKSAIRNSERLLAKNHLDANARLEHERRIQALKKQLELETISQQEKRFVEKYKKVRFFELKKAERKYKKSLKDIESDKDSIHRALVDLLYVKCFPNDRPYLSIYTPAGQADLGKNEIYQTIKANILPEDRISKQLEMKTLQLLSPRSSLSTDSGTPAQDNGDVDDFFLS